jgi:hypothetical protein
VGLVLRDFDVAFQENLFTLENGQNLVAFFATASTRSASAVVTVNGFSSTTGKVSSHVFI